MPIDTWIGFKTEIINLDSGAVNIKIYIDKNESGIWEAVAEAIDDGTSFGGLPNTKSGYAGIRTDFMDVEFKEYKIDKNI